jgi:putative peptide zinc metalloprotease protein
MTGPASQPDASSLADRLRVVRVGLREDLEVSRHLFRGSPSYVVRDPVTFQSQRLDPCDYDVFVRLKADRELGAIFDELVAGGKAAKEDEEEFYQFVMSLHRLGFLQLPVSDEALLYRRHAMKERARRREKLMGFLFLRIPLWNPDAFLDRTVQHVRPLFSRAAFFIWLVLIVSAAGVLVRRWGEFTEPVQGLLAAQNLPLMWITLVVLKVFHEFGHAYACKHYGGHVPEMGAYLIVFTPCAYVDATGSWGFTRKRERLIVCLAGMYVESMIAALGVFAWAMTGPSLVQSLAYNVVFLAGAVTVLFNINPLMRYDGYYILSDLTEIPNLRARSTRYVLDVLKRVFFGIRSPNVPRGRRLRLVLFLFGVFAAAYRVTLLLAISALLASKMFVVGMLLAIVYLGGTAVRLLLKLTQYLWYAEETAQARVRAVALSMLALIIIPAVLFLVPVPAHVHAKGLLATRDEVVVRAGAPGFLEEVAVESGNYVNAGDVLARLRDDAFNEEIATAAANLRASEIRIDAYRMDEPAQAQQEQARARVHRRALDLARERAADLEVLAPMTGRVVECVEPSELGVYLNEGEPIAMIASGGWEIRLVLSEEQMAGARPRVGGKVEFRASALPAQTIEGVIRKIAPSGSETVEHSALTHLGGGDITVDPTTSHATEPYFEITVGLPGADLPELGYAMSGSVRLAAQDEPIGIRFMRRVIQFVNRLMQE